MDLGDDEEIKLMDIRTGEIYSYKKTEHEVCKVATATAQAHTTRTVSQQRVQTKISTHPVPGTAEQRKFLGIQTLSYFRVIRSALKVLPASKVIGIFPKQLHFHRP